MGNTLDEAEFRAFLSGGMPAKYAMEFRKCLKENGKDDTVFYKDARKDKYLSAAFDWGNSPSGSHVWISINKRWQKKIAEKKICSCKSIW